MTVHDAQQCVGIAPFFIDRSLTYGRVVQFLGSGEVASDQLSILSLPERCQEVGAAVANWFAAQYGQCKSAYGDCDCLGHSIDLLQLDGVDGSCPTFEAFTIQLEHFHFAIHDQSTVHTWRIDLPPSMDAYLAMLSKPSRRKVREALKRFATATFSVDLGESERSFNENWSKLTNLHQRRRQSLGECGCFTSTAFSQFLREVARQFHQMGRLDLACISSPSGPIAAEICFRDCKSSFAYQIGIEPDALVHNPGWLVNTASIQHAIDLGLSSFDLCRGDSEYKRHLGASPKICRKLRIVPPCLRSQFLNTAIATGSAVKHFCQDMLHGANSRS